MANKPLGENIQALIAETTSSIFINEALPDAPGTKKNKPMDAAQINWNSLTESLKIPQSRAMTYSIPESLQFSATTISAKTFDFP